MASAGIDNAAFQNEIRRSGKIGFSYSRKKQDKKTNKEGEYPHLLIILHPVRSPIRLRIGRCHWHLTSNGARGRPSPNGAYPPKFSFGKFRRAYCCGETAAPLIVCTTCESSLRSSQKSITFLGICIISSGPCNSLPSFTRLNCGSPCEPC